METWVIVLIIAVLAAVAVGVVWTQQRRRTQELSGRFGPEYRETVERVGDQRRAEGELAERQKRVEQMEIRDLSSEERARFGGEWQSAQAQFVDDPSGAIAAADRLVQELMRARGYEVGEDFERRAADLSVQHGQVVREYRAAHDIAERNAAEGVDTEELRQAMVHYRALFAELLGGEEATRVEAAR